MVRYTAFLLFVALFATTALAQTSQITVRVEDAHKHALADAVVVAVPANGEVRVGDRPHANVVDQVDKEFVPKVLAVLVGTAVTFPNHDNVRHHVYSFSPAKRFELPLYAGVPARPVVFDKPGVVVLGCNIHDWMIGYVYVSESPFFATTGKDGTARFTDLPPGAYVVRVWHPQLATPEGATPRRAVDVGRGQVVDLGFELDLRSEVRVRRAPIPFGRGY